MNWKMSSCVLCVLTFPTNVTLCKRSTFKCVFRYLSYSCRHCVSSIQEFCSRKQTVLYGSFFPAQKSVHTPTADTKVHPLQCFFRGCACCFTPKLHSPAEERPLVVGIYHTPAQAEKGHLYSRATLASPRLCWGTVDSEAPTVPLLPQIPESLPFLILCWFCRQPFFKGFQ